MSEESITSTHSTRGASASDTPTSANQQGPATPQAGKLVAGAVTPQAGNSEASTPRTHDDEMAGGGKAPAFTSLEDALEALKKERAEAARYRKAAAELEDLKQKEANAKLTETEKLQKERDEAIARADAATVKSQERAILSESHYAARELGLNPSKAHTLIDYSAIEFDDDGVPTNILELMKQGLADLGLSTPAARPAGLPQSSGSAQQLRQQAPVRSLGATNPGAGRSVGAFTREQIARMSPREYAANQQAIHEALKRGEITR